MIVLMLQLVPARKDWYVPPQYDAGLSCKLCSLPWYFRPFLAFGNVDWQLHVHSFVDPFQIFPGSSWALWSSSDFFL
jgi:hypothetical protein